MQDSLGPAFFIADSLGLDFLNSVATPDGQQVDWLGSGQGLLSWLEQAKLVPARILDSIRAKALTDELDGVAAEARKLREWFRGFVNARKGRRLALPKRHDLEPLNRLLARDEGFHQLVRDVDGKSTALKLHALRRWRSPDMLLLPIGEAIARAICDEDFTQVKACDGPACTLMFADRTHRHARRWCSMSVCGNRAKQAAHRERKKKHSKPVRK